MNSFQVMNFVDKATPQQLQQMVAARDPYSYMALAKLQEFRDNAMKQKAKQPETPPLALTIPQQIEQLGRPQGIASLPQGQPAMPQAMPQEMPQEMQQAMPQEMQQASGIGPAMAPTGVGGGLVSFKQGGIAHFQNQGAVAANPGDAYSDFGRFMNNLSQKEKAFASQRERDNVLKDIIYKNTRINPFKSYTTEQRAAQDKIVTEARAQLGKPPTPVTANPVPVTPSVPLPEFTVPPGSAPDIKSYPTDLKEPPPNPSGGQGSSVQSSPGGQSPGGQSPGGQGSPGGLGSIALLQKVINESGAAKKAFYGPGGAGEEAIKNIGAAGYNPAEYAKIAGTPAQQKQALTDSITNIKDLLPDHMAPVLDSISKYRAEASAEEGKAPYQGLLKLATALMSTKSPNFLQALGEAGGAGLEEYNKIKALNETRKMKLLEVDANMGAAQNARDRGNLQLAQSLVDKAEIARKDEYHARTNAKVDVAKLQFQLGAAAANVPQEIVANQIHLIAASAQIKSADAAMINATRPQQRAAEIQMQEYIFDPKYPERAARFQDAQNTERGMKLTIEFNKEWIKLETAGVAPAGTTQSAWVNRQLDIALKNLENIRTKPAPPITPRPDAPQSLY